MNLSVSLQGFLPFRSLAADDFSKKHIYRVFVTAGGIGFLIGLFGYALWQDAVEIAQVTAGIVKYPRANPVYIYSTKVWTLYVQICAVLLRAGITERALSLALSGLMGMLSFQAVALCTLAFSRNPLLAVLTPAFSLLTGSFYFYHVYPVYMVYSPYTFGVLGLSYALVTVSFFGLGEYKTGGFLLGLLPAVHPSFGLFVWFFTGVCFFWDFFFLPEQFRKAVKPFLAGLAVTAASFAVYRYVTYDVPRGDPQQMAAYLKIFVKYWDGHRQVPHLNTVAVYAGITELLLCGLWLFRYAKDLPRHSLFILRCFSLSLVIGIGGAFLNRVLPWEKCPDWLVILMPLRISGLPFLGFFPLVAGLYAIYEKKFLVRAVFAIYLLALLAAKWIPKPTDFWQVKVVLTAAALSLIAWRAVNFSGRDGFAMNAKGPFARAPQIILLTVLAAALFWEGGRACVTWQSDPKARLIKAPFFEKVSQRKGMLVISPNMRQIQLLTRRPVLLDCSSLDFIPYTLEAAPITELILKVVYAEDLWHPMKGMKSSGSLIGLLTLVRWQTMEATHWNKLKEFFGITEVLTNGRWRINLPVVIREYPYTLYEIG